MDNNIQEQKRFPFLRLLRANVLLIVLITVLITMLSVLYNVLYVKPVYTVSRSVILRTELVENDEEATNAALGELVIVQMEQHFTSSDYVNRANEKFKEQNPDVKSSISAGAISIIYGEGSLIFKIAYSDLDKDLAAKKLIAIYDVNDEYFEEKLDFNVELISTDNSENDSSRFVVSVSNATMKYVFLGLGLGIVIAMAVVLIKNALDNTVKDSFELEELTGITVIAAIHKLKDEKPKKKAKSKA